MLNLIDNRELSDKKLFHLIIQTFSYLSLLACLFDNPATSRKQADIKWTDEWYLLSLYSGTMRCHMASPDVVTINK